MHCSDHDVFVPTSEAPYDLVCPCRGNVMANILCLNNNYECAVVHTHTHTHTHTLARTQYHTEFIPSLLIPPFRTISYMYTCIHVYYGGDLSFSSG